MPGEVITVVYTNQAKFNDGTDIDWKALETAWKCLSGQNKDYQVAATDGWGNLIVLILAGEARP